MAPGVRSLLALVGAVAMVGGAVAARRALDEKEVNDAIVVRLTCEPALQDVCQRAAAADPRVTATVESPSVTKQRLRALAPGADPGVDAWLTVGPWLAIVDGGRAGRAPLGRSVSEVASTQVVLVGRPDATVCTPTPIGCDKVRSIGVVSPSDDGVALAGVTSLVTSAANVPVAELDRAALTSGDASSRLNVLKQSAVRVGLEAVNTSFSTAQVVVSTAAASRSLAAGRASVRPLPVHAVAQVALLRDDAGVPLGADAPAGAALRTALTEAGWEPTPKPSGLPDAGVLAALQDAWG